MKIRKVLYWITGILFFFIWSDAVWGQEYSVGDTIDNFSLDICENGDGTWDYQTDGINNIVWMNLFTSW